MSAYTTPKKWKKEESGRRLIGEGDGIKYIRRIVTMINIWGCLRFASQEIA